MDKQASEAAIRKKYEWLSGQMNERLRRLWAAAEAKSLGRGGVTLVARATGLSRTTITAGIREVEHPAPAIEPFRLLDPHRSRCPGGGRHCLTTDDPTLLTDLEMLVDPHTRGDPMSPLRWTCKSTRQLAQALQDQGHQICHQTVASLLRSLGYSLQANRKTLEGSSHQDRDAQFERINRLILEFRERNQPVISVDTKKKENLGNYKNGGQEWQPQGEPEKVRAKDFPDKAKGKVIPYGVYDLAWNRGWVGVGVDHDTAAFATHTIHRWWQNMGQPRYAGTDGLLITADGGGSNSYRSRLWLLSLQRLANAIALKICVCHFPPGTSKWNKIEHRMFCHITLNWRGRPLTSREVVVQLIAAVTTTTGLTIHAELDEGQYPLAIKVTDDQLATVRIERHSFHPEWNYTVFPAQWFVQVIF
jgi:hypothetical protein